MALEDIGENDNALLCVTKLHCLLPTTLQEKYTICTSLFYTHKLPVKLKTEELLSHLRVGQLWSIGFKWLKDKWMGQMWQMGIPDFSFGQNYWSAVESFSHNYMLF